MGMILVGTIIATPSGIGLKRPLRQMSVRRLSFVGSNHVVIEAHFSNEFARGGLRGDEAVRPVLNQATLQPLGLDDATQLRSSLNQGA